MIMSEFFPENSVASRVVEAFSKIEGTDRRVAKLAMPKKAYDTIRQELNFNVDTIGPDEFMLERVREINRNIPLDGNVSGFRTNCSLWGAQIVIADQFRAYAEDETPMSVDIPYHAFIGNLTIYVKSRAVRCHFKGPHEQRALDTLREMISESDFRRYLKYGFINVKGTGEKVYQIYGLGHTKVWDKGKMVEEICIMLDDPKIPTTDRVIALKTMVESSEEEFRGMGNIYNMRKAA